MTNYYQCRAVSIKKYIDVSSIKIGLTTAFNLCFAFSDVEQTLDYYIPIDAFLKQELFTPEYLFDFEFVTWDKESLDNAIFHKYSFIGCKLLSHKDRHFVFHFNRFKKTRV